MAFVDTIAPGYVSPRSRSCSETEAFHCPFDVAAMAADAGHHIWRVPSGVSGEGRRNAPRGTETREMAAGSASRSDEGRDVRTLLARI